MWFNTSTLEKRPYYQTQFVNEWWDNGSLPIWITAQKQVFMLLLLLFLPTKSPSQDVADIIQLDANCLFVFCRCNCMPLKPVRFHPHAEPIDPSCVLRDDGVSLPPPPSRA